VNIANSRIRARLLYAVTADVQDTETTMTVTASLLVGLRPAASAVKRNDFAVSCRTADKWVRSSASSSNNSGNALPGSDEKSKPTHAVHLVQLVFDTEIEPQRSDSNSLAEVEVLMNEQTVKLTVNKHSH
jgi:hypothetical protein